MDLVVHWVGSDGASVEVSHLAPMATFVNSSFQDHVFRFYAAASPELLVYEHAVRRVVDFCGVGLCRELDDLLATAPLGRDEEFAGLARDQAAPCGPPGQSSRWSCVRRIPREEYERRAGDAAYGLSRKDAEKLDLPPGTREDHGGDYQLAQIPHLGDPGWVKMKIPPVLHDDLFQWYRKTRGDMTPEWRDRSRLRGPTLKMMPPAPLELQVTAEMRAVMQWWTKQALTKTAFYGARIYATDAVLLNHFDRHDTQLVSAVLQIDQNLTDEDSGWPLEILSGDRDCHEIFLQPGEMVLYEGARLKHGRPMRFRGELFANLFVHFVPSGGPDGAARGESADEL